MVNYLLILIGFLCILWILTLIDSIRQRKRLLEIIDVYSDIIDVMNIIYESLYNTYTKAKEIDSEGIYQISPDLDYFFKFFVESIERIEDIYRRISIEEKK